MKLRPVSDRIVIKKLEAEEKTKSGIVLPSASKEAPVMAEVIAIGSDIANDEKKAKEVKVGDKVIFSTYAGTSAEIDGVEYTVLKFADIVAVVED